MATVQEISPKSGLTTFILCFFLGWLGIHRFYVGKIGTGILMLITAGGLGFWTLYDLFSIVCKNFTDGEGRTVEVDKSPRAPRNIVLIILAVYIVFLAIMMSSVGFMTSDVRSVGKMELSALRTGDVDAAYSYTSSEFQKGVPIETFKKFVAHYPQLKENVDSTFTDINVGDGKASVAGTLQMKDGSTVDIQMDFVKENNQWKVLDINLNKLKADENTSATDTSKASDSNDNSDNTNSSSE